MEARYECVTKSDTLLSNIFIFAKFWLNLFKKVRTINSIPYISTVVILGYGDSLIYFEFLTLKRLDRGVSFFGKMFTGIKNFPLFF